MRTFASPLLPGILRRSAAGRVGCIALQAAIGWACLPAAGLAMAGTEPAAPTSGLTGTQETISLATALIKTMGSLAVVLGLLFLLVLLLKKMGFSRSAASRQGLIRILDIQPLSPKKQVAILDLAGEYVAVGVTEQAISLLAILPANDRLRNAAQDRPGEGMPSFAALLDNALGRAKTRHQPQQGPTANAS